MKKFASDVFYIALTVFALSTTPSFALQIATCHHSERYVVIEIPTLDDSANFLIKIKDSQDQTILCNTQRQKGNFVIKNEGGDYFLALQGDFLILDSGTGPDYRDLKIWDLKSRTKVYTGQYLELLEIRPESIAFWRETSITASPKNCPKLEEWKGYGLAAAIDRLVELHFPDFAITKTSRLRCSSRQ